MIIEASGANGYEAVSSRISHNKTEIKLSQGRRRIDPIELNSGDVVSLKFSPNTRYLAVRTRDNELYLFRTEAKAGRNRQIAMYENIADFKISDDSRFITLKTLNGESNALPVDEAMNAYVEVQNGLFKGLPDAVASLKDRNLTGIRVLLRTNLNVFNDKGDIQDERRLEDALPILKFLLDRGADIILTGHSGRFEDGKDSRQSLRPTAEYFQKKFPDTSVKFYANSINNDHGLNITSSEFTKDLTKTGKGSISILENVRSAIDYEQGQKGSEKREQFGRGLAGLADIFIFDAFGDIASEGATIEDLPRQFVSMDKEVFLGPRMIAEADEFASVAENGVDAVIMGGVKPDKVKLVKDVLKRLRDNQFILLASAPTARIQSDPLIKDIVESGKERVMIAQDYSPDENQKYDISARKLLNYSRKNSILCNPDKMYLSMGPWDGLRMRRLTLLKGLEKYLPN